jgi:hypothetical protein
MMSDLASKASTKTLSTTNVPNGSADEDEFCLEMMREIEVLKEDSTLAVDERDRQVAKIRKRYAAKRLAAEQVRKDREEEELEEEEEQLLQEGEDDDGGGDDDEDEEDEEENS